MNEEQVKGILKTALGEVLYEVEKLAQNKKQQAKSLVSPILVKPRLPIVRSR